MKHKKSIKEISVAAIRNGTVIDHIPPNAVWKIVEILKLGGLENTIIVAANLSSKRMKRKGIIKVSNKSITSDEANRIALIAPTATLNIIKNYKTIKKSRLELPETLLNVVKCFNPNCITNNDDVDTRFRAIKPSPLKVRCHHCERAMKKIDIELI